MNALRIFFIGRSLGELGLRLLLAVVAGGLGWCAVVLAYANALPIESAARAHELAPKDARLAGRYAKVLLTSEVSAADRARAVQIARVALLGDATVEDAVVALGMDAALSNHSDRARRLFDYAQRLSRRDLSTQIWGIEDAVSRGDIAGAVRHYDIALLTKRGASELLYPVLASAVDEPAVRVELVKVLARQPFWAGSFLDYAASHTPDPEAVASFFDALRSGGVSVSNGQAAAMLNRLLAAGKVDAAWSYYAKIRPGSKRHQSRDPGFRADLDVPSAFDWTPIQADGLVSSFQKTSDAGLFDFYLTTATGGLLLQQMQVLAPGDYVLEGHSIAIDQPAGLGPYWTLSCGQDRVLGQIDLPNSNVNAGRFVGRFTVPSGCPLQTLALYARPSDAVSGASGQIDWALLRPAS